MIGFSPQPGGGYRVAFDRHEATLISDLAAQIALLLHPLASVPTGDPGAHSLFAGHDPLASLQAEGSLALHNDPAIARLLPDAYGDEADADSASDFRRYTEQGIVDRKVANALVVVSTLAPSIDDTISIDSAPGSAPGSANDAAAGSAAGSAASSADGADGNVEDGADDDADDSAIPIQLTEAQAQSWLRSLTDIRLTLASRIGIETDEDALEGDDSSVNYDVGSDTGSGSGSGTTPDDTERFLRDIYHWLGFVTESLLAAIDR